MGRVLGGDWARRLEGADALVLDTSVVTMGLRGFYDLLANTLLYAMEKTGVYGPELLRRPGALRRLVEGARGRFLAVEEASYTVALCGLAPHRLNGKPRCLTTRAVVVELARIAGAYRDYGVPSPLTLFVYRGTFGQQGWMGFREFAVALAKALRAAGLAEWRAHAALPDLLEAAAPSLPALTVAEADRPWLLGACWLGHVISPARSPCGSRLSRADVELLALASQEAAASKGEVVLATGDKGLAAAAAASSPAVLYLYKDTDDLKASNDYSRAKNAVKSLARSGPSTVTFTTWADLVNPKARTASPVMVEATVALRDGAPYIDPATVKIIKKKP